MYWQGGTNGIGKTTASFNTIPLGIPFVNADDIAKQIREQLPDTNTQEITNAEAIRQMNMLIAARQSFGIETNLPDNETWLFLKNIQLAGYQIHLYFFCVDNLQTCINRIKNRVLEGGHFVRADIVRQRYEVGLKLLNFYRNIPDKLFLIDSANLPQIKAVLELGKVTEQNDYLPEWLERFLMIQFENSSSTTTESESIETVREKYKRMLNPENPPLE